MAPAIDGDFYRALFEASPDGIVILDDSGIVDCNPVALRLFGVASLEALRGGAMNVFEMGADSPFAQEYRRAVEHGLAQFEWDGKRPDGERLSAEIVLTAFEAQGRKMVRATVRDWTARRRLEEEMRRVNEELTQHVENRTRALQEEVIEHGRAEEMRMRLSTAVECAAEAIVVTAPDGEIVYVNPAFEKTTGYAREAAIGRNPALLKSGRHDEDFYRHLWETISSGNVWQGRMINRRADGSLFEEDATISPIFGRNETIMGYVAVKRDVTHEAELEAQLRQSQKLEAIGTLAGGIAHDFNNILSAVLGFTDLAMLDMPEESQAYACLRQVSEAGRRASALVRQILTFSRQTEQERRPVLLQSVWKEALKLLRGTLPSTIQIHMDISADCGPVLCDPTQMHQVLMNLCTNAYHAMGEEGGALEIAYRPCELEEAAAKRLGIEPGKWSLLTVRDTGSGIPDDVVKRIFEPYFTTKKASQGTGLGLATVHGIVTAHGGAVGVETEPGEGSCFSVYLPTTQEAACDLPPPSDSGKTFVSGSERILLIDDEESIVELGKRALGRLGYRVRGCVDPVQALATVREDPDAFDLVVTDLTMPGMRGMEVAERIHALRPDLPVVLCTGFSDSVLPGDLASHNIRALVPKPIVPSDLAQVIRETLESPPTQ